MSEKLKQVNIFRGRFQPFHAGHLKFCEDNYKKNGDKNKFKELIPKGTEKLFDEYKEQLDKVLKENKI